MFFPIILLVSSTCFARDTQYECGAHGRFEYCIDGFTGCVVGCHCHPGYYFDTESKICEANFKLTQSFRRYNIIEPSRGLANWPSAPDTDPATTPHALEEQVNEIAKDTDDLSDWLYNQFFKTIENQVINKTDDDTINLKGTRRSGSPQEKKKTNKRAHSKPNNKLKKKKSHHGLRKKLLRITEDDSLFDSDSSSSSSSSDSDTSSSSSWESWNTKEEKDSSHGHRKIVMFNKKPRPPLPSFIFLPNVDTPFFPPISLPAPQAIPMYPMLPVPPMLPPYPGQEAPTTITSTEPPTTTTATATTTTMTTDTTTATQKLVDRQFKFRQKFHATPSTIMASSIFPQPQQIHKMKSEESGGQDYDSMTGMVGINSSPKLRALLRNRSAKLQHAETKNKHPLKQQRNKSNPNYNNDKIQQRSHFLEQIQEPPWIPDNDMPQDQIIDDGTPNKPLQNMPNIEDVDFKYLSQLIHRVDLNNTKPNEPTIEFKPQGIIERMKPRSNYRNMPSLPVSQAKVMSRRNFNQRNTAPDDSSYYSNLGRQIAKLIRGIDPNHERQVDIDISRRNNPCQAYINDNGYSPRNYWERSVRSPIRYEFPYMDTFEYLKASNEKLYELENKAEAATPAPTLSLKEIENIINTLERLQKQMQVKPIYNEGTTPSNNSLNINLLPRTRGHLPDPLHLINEITNTQPKLGNGQSDNPTKKINSYVRTAGIARVTENYVENTIQPKYKRINLLKAKLLPAANQPHTIFTVSNRGPRPGGRSGDLKQSRRPVNQYQNNARNYYTNNQINYPQKSTIPKLRNVTVKKPATSSYFFDHFL